MTTADRAAPVHGIPVPEDPLTSVEVLDLLAEPTVVVRSPEQRMDEIAHLMDGAFSRLPAALEAAGLTISGAAFALYHSMPGETIDLEVGFTVVEAATGPLDLGGGFTAVPSELPAGRAARISHVGGFDGLGAAWEAMAGAVIGRGETPAIPFWEIYVTEPSPDMDPATLRTDLVTRLEEPTGR